MSANAAGPSRRAGVRGPSARLAPAPGTAAPGAGRHEAIEEAMGWFSNGSENSEEELVNYRNEAMMRDARKSHARMMEENKRVMMKAREEWARKYIAPPKCTLWEAVRMLFEPKYKSGLLEAAAKVKDKVDKEEERKSLRLSNGRRPTRKK